MYSIEIPEKFTSFSFYNFVLKKVYKFLSEYSKYDLEIDFSKTEYIDPIALTHLLVMGALINETIHKPIILNIPNDPRIKGFLSSVGFLGLAEGRNNGSFYVPSHAQGGYGKFEYDIPPICLFDVNSSNVTKQDIIKLFKAPICKLYSLEEKYSGNYNEEEYNFERNLETASIIMCELLDNIKAHSGKNGYFTIQYIKSNRALKLCVSDYGMGIFKSILEEINKGSYKLKILNKEKFIKENIQNNLASLVEGLFHRIDDCYPDVRLDFGLSGITMLALTKGGIVRVHSIDTQLLITEKNWPDSLKKWDKEKYEKMSAQEKSEAKKYFECQKIKAMEYFRRIVLTKSINDYEQESGRLRVYTTPFNGTHIEVEIFGG